MARPLPLDPALCAEVAASCTASHLRRASRAVSGVYDAALRGSGLRISQFSALVGLAVAGDVPVSRLAAVLALDRTTMTRNLRPLERRGLVATFPGADARSRILRITEAGRAALARALPGWRRAQDAVRSALGAPRWAGLIEGLQAATAAGRECTARGRTPLALRGRGARHARP